MIGQDKGHLANANARPMRALLMLLALAVAAAGSGSARAAAICVANDSEFALAAITAQFAPTTIELVQGTYHFDGTVFDNTGTTLQSFSLLGGYAPGCATRDIDPTNTTVLSASDDTYAELVGDVTIEGIRFEGPGTALYLDWTDFDHDIAAFVQVNIRRNIFKGLQSGLGLNWVPSGSQTLDARIVNNLMHDNGNGSAAACNALGQGTLELGAVEDSDATFTLINNTIVDNSLGGGICYGYAGRLLAYNNILYGNSGPDFSTTNGTNALLIDNLFQTHNYHGIVTELGTLNTDPRLDGNFRPIESPPSPVINSGDNTPHGGLPSHDLDGGPRLVGSAVDRGAYESTIDDEFLQTVSNTNDTGSGSLRSAIASANAHGSGLITFDLGTGCGPHVITLSSPLPPITVPIIINGYSQPGAAPNDLDVGDDATLCVVLESAGAAATRGLVVPASAADSASLFVEGIAFSNFSDTAIDLGAGSGHLVVGNRFGGNASGHALLPNGIGVQLDAAAHDSTVGGDDDGARNILGGSTGSGIALFQGTHGNQVVGNLVGVGWTGDAGGHFTNLGNGTRGVYLAGHDNEISGNWIGDNVQSGVAVANGGATGNTIEDNRIGFAWGTTGPYGNGQAGIHFEGAAGDAPGANKVLDNVVYDNATQGVWVEIGQGNRIRRNSISGNGGLGIDLDVSGVMPNDNDGGSVPPDFANRGLNYPVLTTVAGGFLTGTFAGSLESTLGDYRIDFYQNLGGCDPSDNRQGQYWIGSKLITISTGMVGGDGVQSFSVLLHAGNYPVLPDGTGITATATDTAGNTSELSACVPYLNDTIFADDFDPHA
jgi:parallel beta-helix repeat protein